MNITIIGTGNMACETGRGMLMAELQGTVMISASAQAASLGAPIDDVVVLTEARTFSTRYKRPRRNDV